MSRNPLIGAVLYWRRWVLHLILISAISCHYLHLYNHAAIGDSRLRHIDELKQQLSAVEEKSACLAKELEGKTAELEQSTETETLKAKNEGFSIEVRSLQTSHPIG